MSYRVIASLVLLLCVSLPAQAHPESFHIIIDVSVTVVAQLLLFGVINMMFRGRNCRESLWLGIYGATLVFSILVTTYVRHLYPMWVAPVVIYVLMIIHCMKQPAAPANDASGMRERDSD